MQQLEERQPARFAFVPQQHRQLCNTQSDFVSALCTAAAAAAAIITAAAAAAAGLCGGGRG